MNFYIELKIAKSFAYLFLFSCYAQAGNNLQLVSFANQTECSKGENIIAESVILNSGWQIFPGQEVVGCDKSTTRSECENSNEIWCGNCKNADAVTGCQSGCKDVCITIEMTTTTYANEESWSIEGTSCSGPQNPPYPDNMKTTEYCCLPGGSYTIVCKDAFADGWDGATLDIQGKTVCSMTRDDGSQITKTIEITDPCDTCKEKACIGPGACLSVTSTPPTCLYSQINSESWSLFNFTNEDPNLYKEICADNPVGSPRTFKYGVCTKYPWIDEGIYPYIIYKRVERECTLVLERYDSDDCSGVHKDTRIGFDPEKCVVVTATKDSDWDITAIKYSISTPSNVQLSNYDDPFCEKKDPDSPPVDFGLNACIAYEDIPGSIIYRVEGSMDCGKSAKN